jgi:hypothetical protein
MIVDGRLRTLGTIGELASAVGRTSHMVRGWERHDLIPPPPLTVQPGQPWVHTTTDVPGRVDLGDPTGGRSRRLRAAETIGVILRHQQQMWSTWRSVMDSLMADEPSVTDGVEQ